MDDSLKPCISIVAGGLEGGKGKGGEGTGIRVCVLSKDGVKR